MPVILLNGSSSNCGKSHIAAIFKAYYGGTVLSSDKIRIPIHNKQIPDYTLWDRTDKATRQQWYFNFDNVGPWGPASIATADYILEYTQSHPDEMIYIEGQFQLDKQENIKLVTQLLKKNVRWLYVKTPLAICEMRHSQELKSYPVELIGRHALGNMCLAEHLLNDTWRKSLTPEQESMFSTATQTIIDGSLPAETHLRLIEPVYIPKCLYPLVPIMCGTQAFASLQQDIIDMNITRATMDLSKVNAVQGNMDELSKHCFQLESIVPPELYSSIESLYTTGNLVLRASEAHIKDLNVLMNTARTPPLFIPIAPEDLPSDAEVLLMSKLPISGYDLPVLSITSAGMHSGIPEVYRPYQKVIEIGLHFFLTLRSLNGDTNDMLIIVSDQFMEVPRENSGSLIGLHYDNIQTPADRLINTTVNTTQYPSLIFTDEIGGKENEEEDMGTVVYSHSLADTSNMEKQVALMRTDTHFLPYEGAQLMLLNAPNQILLHKGRTSSFLVLNHLHKAVKNKRDTRVRSQIRMMVVQRTNETPEGWLYGYSRTPDIPLRTPDLIPSYPGSNPLVPRIFPSYPGSNPLVPRS